MEVICVKGSKTIEAKGLPSIRLVLELRKLKKLSDENMVNLQRANLLDSIPKSFSRNIVARFSTT